MMSPAEALDGARCAAPDVDPEWFFDGAAEEDRSGPSAYPNGDLARATCALCPVQRECDAQAADIDRATRLALRGIWAGKDETDRRADRKAEAKARIQGMVRR
jgi:hypothetical protein